MNESEIYLALERNDIPEHMHYSVVQYVINGRGPGHFLEALLENNLRDTFARADEKNREAIPRWVEFLYWCVPGACWGSRDRVEAWIAKGGIYDPSKAES